MSTLRVATSTPHLSLPIPPLPEAGENWALLLEVDGTLLDFADDPRAVHASSALLALLHKLHTATAGALALVSGHALDDLDQLFDRPRWAAIGMHGLELRRASGAFRRPTVPLAQQAHMHREVFALAVRFEGVQVEDKQQTVALHCRHQPVQLTCLHEAASKLVNKLPGYQLQPGNPVLEFKPAGMDKGRAVMELLQHEPFAGRVPVYLGDDLTDEHAFDAVNRRHGLSIRVGAREPCAAHFTRPDPAATEAWLIHVLDALMHAAHAHPRLPDGGPVRQC